MLISILLILPLFLVLYLIRPPRVSRPGLEIGFWTGAVAGLILLVSSMIPVAQEFIGPLASFELMNSKLLFNGALAFVLLNLCLNLHWRRLKTNVWISSLAALLTASIGPLLIALFLWVFSLLFSWSLSFPVAMVLGWLLSLVDYRPLLNQRERGRLTSLLRLQMESHQLISSILILAAALILNELNLGQMESNLQGLSIQLGMSITGGLCIGLVFAFLAKEFLQHARQYELRWLTLMTAFMLIVLLCEMLGFSYFPAILILGIYLSTALDHHPALKKDRKRLRQTQQLLENLLCAFLLTMVIAQFKNLTWSLELVVLPIAMIVLSLLGKALSMAFFVIPRVFLKKTTLGQFFLLGFGSGPGMLPLILLLLVIGTVAPLSQPLLLGLCLLMIGHVLIQAPLLPMLTGISLPDSSEETEAAAGLIELEAKQFEENEGEREDAEADPDANEQATLSSAILDESPEHQDSPLNLSLLENNAPGSSIFIESGQEFGLAHENDQTMIVEHEEILDPGLELDDSPLTEEADGLHTGSQDNADTVPATDHFESKSTEPDAEESAHPLIPVIRQERGDRNYDPYRLELKKEVESNSAESEFASEGKLVDEDDETEVITESTEENPQDMDSLEEVLKEDTTMVWAESEEAASDELDEKPVSEPGITPPTITEIPSPEADPPSSTTATEDSPESPSNDELSDAMAALNEDPPDIFSPPSKLDLEALVEEEGSLNEEELAAFNEEGDELTSHFSGSPSAILQDADMIYDIDFEEVDEEDEPEDPEDGQSR